MNSYPYYFQEPFDFSTANEGVYNPYDGNNHFVTEDPYRPQNPPQFPQQGVSDYTQYVPPYGPPPGSQSHTPPYGPPSGGQPHTPPYGPPSGGQPHTPPYGPPSGSQPHTPPYGPPSGDQQHTPPYGQPPGSHPHTPPYGPPSGGQQQTPPYGPPLGSQPHTPPYGPPPGGQHTPPLPGGAPTTPPPLFVPQLTHVPVTAIQAPSMRRCLHRNTYVWLMNGRRFWFYPTYVGITSVAGYRWSESRQRWAYFGIDASEIRSFQCY